MGELTTGGLAEIMAMEQSLLRLKQRMIDNQRSRAEDPSIPDDALALARFIYVLRRIRDCRFAGAYFGEPAWDILLNLFIARLEGKEATISSVSIAACVPPTTALRWITTLVEDGLIMRTPDPHDARRVILDLSTKGYGQMKDVLEAMRDSVGDTTQLAAELAGRDRDKATAGLRLIADA